MRSSPNNVLPIVNATGIEGSWDFDLDGLQLNRGRGFGANTPIVAAVARQLGLTLERQDVPQPVIVVTGVNRQPTSNVADVDLRLPPEPVEFEVASIRPCDAVDLRQGWRATPSGQLTTGCQTIGMHIARAWNLTREFRATPDRIVASIDSGRIAGAPGWFNSKRYNVVAKAPIPVDGAPFDPNYRAMLRNLLTERFKITSHYEDRPVDVYTLIADRPKLTKADPSARSECRSSGLVPNTSGDAQGYATVITCRNATMAQFAEELSQAMAIAVTGRRIVDETGIHGTWDLTLTYRVTAGSSRVPVLPGTALAIPSAADPDGSLSPLEAVAKQLGLRLTEARRPRPVLVIDHIEETPTEN
jgi:uncharacterized protein (TIGR03435 family)